jgi:hypothetical protein
VEHVYREAAAMFPADEDLLEHSDDLTRKKQLVSQECCCEEGLSRAPPAGLDREEARSLCIAYSK